MLSGVIYCNWFSMAYYNTVIIVGHGFSYYNIATMFQAVNIKIVGYFL